MLFGLVGGFGTVLNTAILWVLHTGLGLHYLAAAAVATESAIVSNFLGNEHITFASEGHGNGKLRRFLRFQLVSIGTLAGTLSLLWLLVQLLGESRVLLCNLIAIGGMFLVNFAVNRTLTWKLPSATEPERGESLAR
ncbi:MAG TPA: GtrA family protein [Longimicrobiaceae bacterium]|nr:GtrA family protein [Longimicrobiaceae bacterium]